MGAWILELGTLAVLLILLWRCWPKEGRKDD
jgi:hypothetical protein